MSTAQGVACLVALLVVGFIIWGLIGEGPDDLP